MPIKGARIILRHEYSGADAEDIQAGLRVWAAFIAERLRKSGRADSEVTVKKEGRPA
jgi:hypothetical protein